MKPATTPIQVILPADVKAEHLNLRVYYEDTDAGGVVYYANYLKFIERGRTEFIRSMGYDNQRLLQDYGLLFVVKSLQADYEGAARLDDTIEVTTQLTDLGAATLDMKQIIRHEGRVLFAATVKLVALSPQWKIMRLPPVIRQALQQNLSSV